MGVLRRKPLRSGWEWGKGTQWLFLETCGEVFIRSCQSGSWGLQEARRCPGQAPPEDPGLSL